MTPLPITGIDKARGVKTDASSSPPRVLLLTAHRWLTTLQLALGLSEAGFAVDAWCLAGHPLARTKAVSRICRLNAFSPINSLRYAIETCEPTILMPCDDISAARVHELYAESHKDNASDQEIQRLIARSLGDPTNFPVLYARDRIAALARTVGLLTPLSFIVHNEEELARQLRYIHLPVVLKTDGSSGGVGVRIIMNADDAIASFRRLVKQPTIARAAKRIMFDRDPNPLAEWLLHRRPTVSIHTFISGISANAAVSCWQGEILAHVCVEVLVAANPTGPARVVRVIKNRAMSNAVERMVRLLKLSGLCGFDFILDGNNGSAYLIDLNPRATQTSHLVSAEGDRLFDPFAMKLGATPNFARTRTVNESPIVLFPHGFGFADGSTNPYLKFAYDDIPIEHPELIELGREFYRKQNSFIARSLRRASSKTWLNRMFDAA